MFDKKSVSSYDAYLGNLFRIENGVGTVSDLKYVVIKNGKEYFAYPGEEKVLVGCYKLTKEDDDIAFLINAERICRIKKINRLTSKDIVNIIIENNCKEKIKKYY